jgi:hypothetical protein
MGVRLARYLGESLGVTDVRTTISEQFTLWRLAVHLRARRTLAER